MRVEMSVGVVPAKLVDHGTGEMVSGLRLQVLEELSKKRYMGRIFVEDCMVPLVGNADGAFADVEHHGLYELYIDLARGCAMG